MDACMYVHVCMLPTHMSLRGQSADDDRKQQRTRNLFESSSKNKSMQTFFQLLCVSYHTEAREVEITTALASEVKLRNKLEAEEIVAKVAEDSGQISSIMMKALLSCNRILSVANSVPSGNSRIFSLTQEHHDSWKKEGGTG